jgi:hypothetical protein
MTWHSVGPLAVSLALALAGFLFVRRYGGGPAMAELERANRVLEKAVRDLKDDNTRLTAEVAALRARTDVGLAIAPVLEALKLHEERAATRSERTLTVLDLIAGKLGPEVEAA